MPEPSVAGYQAIMSYWQSVNLRRTGFFPIYGEDSHFLLKQKWDRKFKLLCRGVQHFTVSEHLTELDFRCLLIRGCDVRHLFSTRFNVFLHVCLFCKYFNQLSSKTNCRPTITWKSDWMFPREVDLNHHLLQNRLGTIPAAPPGLMFSFI